MTNICIESYTDRNITLRELTDLTEDDLRELEMHLTLSAHPMSERFRKLLHELRKFNSSLDTSKAS